tara:strand:- start:82 stop:342 length:261 start_codon:yes stop_codon:yes gene_type:complete
MPGIEKKGRSKIASYKTGSGPCWKNYKMVGMKSKGGRKVPNCVPKKAKHGASIDAGGMSALGRIEKAGIVRGGGAAIRGLKFQGVK